MSSQYSYSKYYQSNDGYNATSIIKNNTKYLITGGGWNFVRLLLLVVFIIMRLQPDNDWPNWVVVFLFSDIIFYIGFTPIELLYYKTGLADYFDFMHALKN